MCLAIPGKLVKTNEAEPLERMGTVDFGGIAREVSLAYVPDAQVGDYVLIHVGFAISKVDEDEALRVFEYLKEIDNLEELKEAVSS
jgi:hydrogenase expression/formation protein HypC